MQISDLCRQTTAEHQPAGRTSQRRTWPAEPSPKRQLVKFPRYQKTGRLVNGSSGSPRLSKRLLTRRRAPDERVDRGVTCATRLFATTGPRCHPMRNQGFCPRLSRQAGSGRLGKAGTQRGRRFSGGQDKRNRWLRVFGPCGWELHPQCGEVRSAQPLYRRRCLPGRGSNTGQPGPRCNFRWRSAVFYPGHGIRR